MFNVLKSDSEGTTEWFNFHQSEWVYLLTRSSKEGIKECPPSSQKKQIRVLDHLSLNYQK